MLKMFDKARGITKSMTDAMSGAMSGALSWKTMAFLGFFSWFMAFIARVVAELTYGSSNSFTSETLSSCGWIFLIIAVDWWTMEHPSDFLGFSFGTWVTGALVCIFLFVELFENIGDEFPSVLFVAWPVISAIIKITHICYPASSKYRERLNYRAFWTVILCHLLISCWIQFYFSSQYWLNNYPTLLSEDFEKSAFIMRVEPVIRANRGEQLLNALETDIKANVDNQPWFEVDQVISKYTNLSSDDLKETIKEQVPEISEDIWWQLISKIEQINPSQKTLILQARWRGPTLPTLGSQLTQTCQIVRINDPGSLGRNEAARNLVFIAKIECSASDVQTGESPSI